MAVGRFAPSPTGPLHLGSLRTALLAWLFARSAGSAFLLRVEDLDLVAARPEIEASHRTDLAELGLDWDGEVIRQSSRRPVYDEAIDRLVAAGRTYPCFCTRREIADAAAAPHGEHPDGAYPGTCRGLTPTEVEDRLAAGRPAALRLRAEGARVAAVDRLHGAVAMVVDDFVVRRNDGVPAYNLAVVVDDAAQGVEEVVRGDDLLPTTPRQVLLTRLLELPPVTYAHVPLVLGPDGRRLAKRHGSVTLDDLRVDGLTGADVCGLLAASVGLAEPGRPVRPADLLDRFDPDRLPRRPWIFEGARPPA